MAITIVSSWPAQDGPQSWAGYRGHRRNRITGTTVVLLDGRAADLDTDGGRWSLMCEDHGSVCAFMHQHDAREFMAHPGEWCEGCSGHDDPAGEDIMRARLGAA